MNKTEQILDLKKRLDTRQIKEHEFLILKKVIFEDTQTSESTPDINPNKNLLIALAIIFTLVIGAIFLFNYLSKVPSADKGNSMTSLSEQAAQTKANTPDNPVIPAQNPTKSPPEQASNNRADIENNNKTIQNTEQLQNQNIGDDGQISSIQIGNQIWLNNNLDVIKFRNGDQIPEARNMNEWKDYREKEEPAWCYYNFENKNKRFGKIYNWYANFDPRVIAPLGWHVPKTEEWKRLLTFLGGDEHNNEIGGKMVSEEWVDYFGGRYVKRNCESGFNAIIAGEFSYGHFGGGRVTWWSSDEPNSYYYLNQIHHSTKVMYIDTNKERLKNRYVISGYSFYENVAGQDDGYYVRCVKD